MKINRKQVIWTIGWTIVLLGVVGGWLECHGELNEAWCYLREANLLYLLLIIPIIHLMYWSAGSIWYQCLRKTKLDKPRLASIQFELNTVNTVVPYVDIDSGSAYAEARLGKFGISADRASGLYSFRYLVSIITKWIEVATAATILVLMGGTTGMSAWSENFLMALPIIVLVCSIVVCLFVILRYNTTSRWARVFEKWLVDKLGSNLRKKLRNLSITLGVALSQESVLTKAFGWGMLYSLLEVAPYMAVAAAVGHPELMLQIIVASGVAIIVGIVLPTPMGIGGSDGAMIWMLCCMGSSMPLASVVALTTRIIILIGTTAVGIPFWRKGMREIAS